MSKKDIVRLGRLLPLIPRARMTPNTIYAWTWIAAWAVAALVLIVA